MEISWDFFFFFFFFAGRAAKVRYAVFENQAAEATRQRSAWRSTADSRRGRRERVARGVDEQAIMSLAFDEYGRPFIVIKVSFAFPRRGPRPPPRTQTFGPIWLKGAKIGHTGAGREGLSRILERMRGAGGLTAMATARLPSPLFPFSPLSRTNPKQTHTLNTT